jgi:hypothetical protein
LNVTDQAVRIGAMTNDDPAPGQPAQPPAAKTVKEGSETEETSNLRAELDRERAARKKAETDAAHAQDEFHRLKQSTKGAPATPPPAKKSRWTFFDAED